MPPALCQCSVSAFFKLAMSSPCSPICNLACTHGVAVYCIQSIYPGNFSIKVVICCSSNGTPINTSTTNTMNMPINTMIVPVVRDSLRASSRSTRGSVTYASNAAMRKGVSTGASRYNNTPVPTRPNKPSHFCESVMRHPENSWKDNR